MNVPTDLKYCPSHEWVRLEGDVATIGISDHAQEELTDVEVESAESDEDFVEAEFDEGFDLGEFEDDDKP